MAKIVISTTDQQKEAWFSYCKSRSTKSSPVLKMMMKKAMGDNFSADNEDPTTPKRMKLDIRLNEQYRDLMTERAEQEGFPSRQSWAATLLLSTLKNSPVLTDIEVKELRASNRQLAAIGRNINQIARALNMEIEGEGDVNEQLLNTIKNEINEHKKKVATLIAHSLNRWSAND